MATQQYKNPPLISAPTVWTTLATDLAAGATSATVTAATVFPSVPQFEIAIGDELLTVTAIVGNVLTVVRGVESTTDANHASGVSVVAPLTAGGLGRVPALMSELIGSSITYTDTSLGRGDAAGQLTVSAGASFTSFRLKNGSAAEFGAIYWDGSNNFVVGTQGGVGAGTARDTILGSAVAAPNGLYFATEATSRWQINPSGHLKPFTTAAYDLGTDTVLVRAAYVGKLGNLTSNGLVTTSAGDGTLGITALGTGVATFLTTPSSANLAAALTNETGTGVAVFNDTPTLIAPVLGTPTSGTLTNCTGYPVANIANLGTGVATFLATPSSANLITALTDETGTGACVFANTPTLVTPILGTPQSGVLTSCTGLPLTTGITGTLGVANGGTGAASASITAFNNITGFSAAGTTGTTSTNLVFSTSPTFITPILGTPQSGVLTSCTGLPMTTGVTGVLAVANGGTNAASASITAFNNITGFTASGSTGTTSTNLVFSASPTFTGFVSTSSAWQVGTATQLDTSFLILSSGMAVSWTNGNRTGTQDVFLYRGGAAATLQLGANLNGTAVSQTFKGPNGITGTDTIGGNLTMASGAGTGAGAASSLIFQTPTLTSGTTQQTLATRMTIATAGTTIDTLTVTNATTLSSTLAANGTITMGSGVGIATNTGTGTILATAASQKLAFWGAAAIIQPTTGIAASTFTANTSGIANDTATFDGYTLGQITKALRNAGLLA